MAQALVAPLPGPRLPLGTRRAARPSPRPAGPGRATIVRRRRRGAHVVVGAATIDGNGGDGPASAAGPAARAGRFDREAFDQRVRDAEDALRDERLLRSASPSAGGHRGRTGAGRRHGARRARRPGAGRVCRRSAARRPARDRSCPIERLRSVDEDLVEDASRNIEQYLQARRLPRRVSDGHTPARRRRAADHLHGAARAAPRARGGGARRRHRAATRRARRALLKLERGRAVCRRARGNGGGGAGRVLPGARLRCRAGGAAAGIPAGRRRARGRWTCASSSPKGRAPR